MSDQNVSGSSAEGGGDHGRRTRHGFFGGIVIGGVLGVLLAVTIGAFAQFDGPRSARFASLDPERAIERAALVIDFALGQVDATEAQQAQITAVVQAAIEDLHPALAGHGAAHEALRGILAQPFVDRAALEELRAARLQQADEVSQRLVQTLAEAADVLTQQQRVELMALGERFRH